LRKRRKTAKKLRNPAIFEGSYLGNTFRDLFEIWNAR